MADMSDVLNVLTSIENYLVDLPAKILLKADQIYIVNGLSDVSENLGIITAGEFRAGNRLDPGRLFSGMRMAYPPMVYDLGGTPTNWNLVGIEADVLQFGVRASDGKLVAGGGAVILDEGGITAVGGTIAGWTINTDHLLSPNTPGIEINSTGSIKTTNFVSGVTGVGWRINETGDVEFNNAVIRGELRTTVFTYQEIQAVSGTMGVFKSAGVLKTTTGTIPAVSGSTTLSIKDPEYGHTQLFSAGDILRIKDGIRDTWLSVDSVSDETTYYDYVCTVKSGTTGGTYTAGQAVVNYGADGQGFLLMEAIGTGAPYFSVRTTSAAPWTGSTNPEHVRMGNLDGNWGYSSAIYGSAIGKYATGVGNITIDPTNGVRIRVYDTTIMEFKSTGAFITNVLNMTGANAAIAIGATPPTAKDAGTGLWLSKDGLFSLASNVYQVKIDATDGSLYAGGGDIVLNANGLIFYGDIDWYDENSIFWRTRISTTYDLYGQLSFKIPDEHGVNGTLTVLNNNITTNDEAIIRLYSETKSHWAEVYLDNRYNNYSSLSLSVSTKFDRTELKLENTRVTLDVGNGSASTRVLYITDTYLRYYGELRAYRNTTDYTGYIFVPLTTPLTSTSWNGDDTKTVGTITIDTSSVFGAPAGIKAALIFFRAKWTSASTSSFMYVRPIGATRYTDIIYADNTSYQTSNATVPCDENGDFEFVVGGANATEVICEIWGYWL
jgi:hypothetical protein